MFMNGIFREIFVDDCLHIFCVDDFEIFKVNGGGNKKEEVFDKIRQIKGNKLKQKEIELNESALKQNKTFLSENRRLLENLVRE